MGVCIGRKCWGLLWWRLFAAPAAATLLWQVNEAQFYNFIYCYIIFLFVKLFIVFHFENLKLFIVIFFEENIYCYC